MIRSPLEQLLLSNGTLAIISLTLRLLTTLLDYTTLNKSKYYW